MTAIERLREIIKKHSVVQGSNFDGSDVAEKCGYCIDYSPCETATLALALEAILAMPMWTDKSGIWEVAKGSGYNQCLAEVKALIEGKVT